jgi:hypothetical protein
MGIMSNAPRTGLMRHEELGTTKRYDYRPDSEMHEVAPREEEPVFRERGCETLHHVLR